MVLAILSPRTTLDRLDSVTLTNPTTLARQDIVTTMLPCPQGRVTDTTLIAVADPGTGQTEQCQWAPIGARWPDGSVALARITFPVTLAGSEVRDCVVGIGAGAITTFTPHPLAVAGIATLLCELEVEGSTLTLSSPQIAFLGPRTMIVRYLQRFPSTAGSTEQVWRHLDIEVLHGLRFARIYHTHGNSYARTNPLDPRIESAHPGTDFDITQTMRLRFGHSELLDVRFWQEQEWTMGRRITASQFTEFDVINPATVPLPTQARLPDGYSIPLDGVMLFDKPAATGIEQSTIEAERLALPVIAKCNGWVATGLANRLFGGVVPPIPSWFASAQQAEDAANSFRAAQYFDTLAASPFNWKDSSHCGSNRNPGDTGQQRDFSRLHCWPEYRTRSSVGLLSARRSACAEYLRPTHFREWDTCAVVTKANHPQLWFWNNRYFWNSPNTRSPDALGKGFGLTGPVETGGTGGVLPIFGHPREHYSHQNLLHYTQITGDWRFVNYLNEMCERWMFVHQVGSGSPSIDGPDAARAVDRGHVTGAHLYFLTGRPDLRAAIDARINDLHDNAWEGRGRPLEAFYVPDNLPLLARYHPTDKRGVTPWQCGMAVGGLMAAYSATANPKALALAKALSKYICKYAIQDRRAQAYQVINTINEWGQNPGLFVGCVPGDILIERDAGGAEVARGTYVGEQHDGFNGYVHVKNCTAMFPCRNGAVLENLTNPSATAQRIRFRAQTLQIPKGLYWNDGQPMTQAQWEEWDPRDYSYEKQPYDDPKFKHIEWADNTDYLLWAAPAAAYGKTWAAEAGDAVWLDIATAWVELIKPTVRPDGHGWDYVPAGSAHQLLALPNIWS